MNLKFTTPLLLLSAAILGGCSTTGSTTASSAERTLQVSAAQGLSSSEVLLSDLLDSGLKAVVHDTDGLQSQSRKAFYHANYSLQNPSSVVEEMQRDKSFDSRAYQTQRISQLTSSKDPAALALARVFEQCGDNSACVGRLAVSDLAARNYLLASNGIPQLFGVSEQGHIVDSSTLGTVCHKVFMPTLIKVAESAELALWSIGDAMRDTRMSRADRRTAAVLAFYSLPATLFDRELPEYYYHCDRFQEGSAVKSESMTFKVHGKIYQAHARNGVSSFIDDTLRFGGGYANGVQYKFADEPDHDSDRLAKTFKKIEKDSMWLARTRGPDAAKFEREVAQREVPSSRYARAGSVTYQEPPRELRLSESEEYKYMHFYAPLFREHITKPVLGTALPRRAMPARNYPKRQR